MAEIKVEMLRCRVAVEAWGGGRRWVAAAAAEMADGGIITYQNNVRRGKMLYLKQK